MENRTESSIERELFRTRYSVVLLAVIFIPFVCVLFDFIQNPNSSTVISPLILFFVLAVFFSIRYENQKDKLIFISFFVFKTKIEISEIDEIKRSYIPLSSNAASLKRLYGKMKKGKYPSCFLISPHNEERFLERLKEINPSIKIRVGNKKGFYRFWDWDL